MKTAKKVQNHTVGRLAEARKPGAAMSPEERRKLPAQKCIGHARQFARTDWSGKDPIAVLAKKFAEWLMQEKGLQVPESICQLVAAFAKQIAEDQVAGVRKRQEPPLAELERRLSLLAEIRDQRVQQVLQGQDDDLADVFEELAKSI